MEGVAETVSCFLILGWRLLYQEQLLGRDSLKGMASSLKQMLSVPLSLSLFGRPHPSYRLFSIGLNECPALVPTSLLQSRHSHPDCQHLINMNITTCLAGAADHGDKDKMPENCPLHAPAQELCPWNQ